MKKYEKDFTSQISFPLGGIGSGSIGLAGNGSLIDWEIFNAPAKGTLNGRSHFAVRAEKDGKVIDARILNGDYPVPYTGQYNPKLFQGYGWGPRSETMAGMPHFEKHIFKGEYPVAQIDFEDPKFPAETSLKAWSPFIPGNSYDSSAPVACFEIEIVNDTDEDIDYTVVGILANPFTGDKVYNEFMTEDGVQQILVCSDKEKDSLEYGDLSLSCKGDNVSYQEYWYRGGWQDQIQVYWNDMNKAGKFANRSYEPGIGGDVGMLANHFSLQPGEKKTVQYVISWNVPNRSNNWSQYAADKAKELGIKNQWRNWYATQWEDSAASGRYVMKNFDKLNSETSLFKNSLFDSTLPEVVLEGISATMSVLKTATCLRLEDGTFYGWEGIGTRLGSCEGTCTHVWNYAQALPFLFPDLERSIRDANYKYNINDDGAACFRMQLPLGIKPDTPHIRPCVDGQFGDVMKSYREWKISGDDSWLKAIWPSLKKTIEYAWDENNFDKWDLEKSGVITGRQHHTLDMELFGPSSWLNSIYLGALKAASEMAEVLGENDFAAECMEIFEKGKEWTNENLFNGEYYIQKVDVSDKEQLMRFSTNENDSALKKYWSEEHGELKYQVANGCEIDMLLGQWFANIYGLGEILDCDKCRKTLESLFKYNFVEKMRDVANTWRLYALNDEAGLLMCSWPNNDSPVIPVPYSSETMHGFEWAAASQMLMYGLYDEGMKVIKGIRDRYDGKRRNPWNEMECGSNYARSMASYGLLNTFSGFSFDMRRGYLGFSPLQDQDDFKTFWSLGASWGNFEQNSESAELLLSYGELELNEVKLSGEISKVLLNGNEIECHSNCGKVVFSNTLKLKSNDILKFIS